MVNKKYKISGKIINNDVEYLFILTDFVLDIKLINSNEQLSGIQFYPKYIKSENGFVKGTTDNDEYIYFAVGNKDIEIYRLETIIIDFYIKFNQGYSFDKEVTAIKFIGGTLNQFARLDILGIPIKEDGYLKVPYKNKNEMKMDINNNTVKGNFIFRGSARSGWDAEDGISVFEDEASLYIEAAVTQKNIIKIFRYVSNIFKFFTFRNNVGGFDLV